MQTSRIFTNRKHSNQTTLPLWLKVFWLLWYGRFPSSCARTWFQCASCVVSLHWLPSCSVRAPRENLCLHLWCFSSWAFLCVRVSLSATPGSRRQALYHKIKQVFLDLLFGGWCGFLLVMTHAFWFLFLLEKDTLLRIIRGTYASLYREIDSCHPVDM